MKAKTQECSPESPGPISPQDDEDTEEQPKRQASSSYQERGQGHRRGFWHWGCGQGRGMIEKRKGEVGRTEGRKEGEESQATDTSSRCSSGWQQNPRRGTAWIPPTVTEGDCTIQRLVWSLTSTAANQRAIPSQDSFPPILYPGSRQKAHERQRLLGLCGGHWD